MSDVRTLGEISTRTSMLVVACSRCERRGRYQLASSRLTVRVGKRRC